MPDTLDEWLSYIEQLHPKSIDMGLERVSQVRDAMGIALSCPVVTVAGTNGKGSTAAMLESIYIKAGYTVGCYSSPHFIEYNERLRINLKAVTDEQFCKAFKVVDQARLQENIELTYFEFGTLAAVWLISELNVDVAILEVGLGGRLDAVNIFEPNCAIVTNVDLDHQDFLGDTRESIGFEKAGVFRAGVPAICGDHEPPHTLIEHALDIKADLKLIGRDFTVQPSNGSLKYQGFDEESSYEFSSLGLLGAFQFNNAASALAAIESLQQTLPVKNQSIKEGLSCVKLPGRFEVIQSNGKLPAMIFDVAHNPNAASGLIHNLVEYKQHHSCEIYAVFSMLHNKDWQGVVDAVSSCIDRWYVAEIDHPRKASAESLELAIKQVPIAADVKRFSNLSLASSKALDEAKASQLKGKNVTLLFFGSFFTVSEAKHFLKTSIRV